MALELEEVVKEIQHVSKDVETKIKAAIVEVEALKKAGKDWEGVYQKQDEIIQKAQKHLETLQEQVDKLDTKLNRPSLGAFGEVKPKSLAEVLQDNLVKHAADLLKMKDSKSAPGVSMDVKAAANMLINTNYTGSIGLTTWDNEFSRPARRDPYLRQLFRTRPINTMYVAWAEMANRDGGATTVSEGAVKPLLDFDIVEATKKVEKIAVRAKASKEALADIPYLSAEINQELVESVNLELDNQLYAGNGTTPNLSGIKGYAPTIAFTGTPFATGIKTPNRADAIMATIAVVQSRFFQPNYVLVNPLDAAMLMFDKDTQGNGINRPYLTGDGALMVGPARVVANMGVPVGEFLVGDFTKAILGIREEVNIQLGYENDDFSRNLVTVLAEMRAVSYVKSNNLNAFAKGVFATVITAITAA